ncbi:unnamed protein product [Echinostoma caproni]|uniref:Fibronectin type-III domain-containing protein n=1 Tax=Echinostoma caproni TaxID=27848 RepID=A0A183AUV5_9TREM|nr:unnamed protein product [Echinostoma caproni]
MWTFDGGSDSARKNTGLLDLPATAPASGSGHPGSSGDQAFPDFETDSGSFSPDHFLVLARPLVKPKSDTGGSYEYGAYWATRINGSDAREGMLTGLNRTASYQVIVYGVRGDGDRRQITRFSKAAYVNLATADHTGPYSLLRSLINNRLMYIILGGIAAVMFFVVFVFILLCLCRQHRDRRETNQRKKQNGFVQSYKDTTQYMPVSTTDGANQPVSGMNNPSNGAGGMMMMSNLQCSAFSDHSASNHGGGGGMQGMNGTLQHQQQQQQQAELKQQQHQQQQQLYMQQQQQQQADQYAAAMAMSKELMQQQQQQQAQHQSMLGSQMHLHQSNQPTPIVYHHPQHHQSHHSLLFPSSGPMHQVQAAPMYQSGTLPGGPRYMRQGFTPAHHQFGSQQPLNRATTPAQGMLDVMDYHMQPGGVYAHQQPQLPPVPHPQNTDLPPHHLMMNGAQRQMGYYPGPMTPSGTSLKREPPTGGSLQDGSAYGECMTVSLTF